MTGCGSFRLLLSLAAPGSAASQDYQNVIDRAVTRGVPGIQALVRQGSNRWEGVSGLASVEAGHPMGATDRIRIASITKMMTYAAIMELVSENRLRRSDLATARTPPGTLDGIPHAGRITIAELLDHTSGLHNFNGADGADFFADLFSDPDRSTRRWTAQQLLGYARRPSHPPSGAPGERRAYSSTGYIVLEMILEHVGGQPFADRFRDRIFTPAGMTRTGVEGADFGGDSIVPSYGIPAAEDRSRPSPFTGRSPIRQDGLVDLSAGLEHYNAWARAAGAVATTAGDLGRFMDGVTAGKFIVLADQKAQFAAARSKPDQVFGWNGGSWGIQATILHQPSRDLTVIVLTNGTKVGLGSSEIARELLSVARQAR